MARNMTKDMTTGNPVKLILLFSIPLLIGNIFQQFYSMVDTIIVGRFIGVDALAAVGSTGSMSFLINGFVVGLTSGFAVLVSQKFGAKDEEGLKKAVASALVLALIATGIVTLVSVLLAKPMLHLMNTPDNIIDDANAYIIIIYAGTIATVVYNIIAGILRALGDSKTPLYFLIVASILNIVLDIVFIVNFSMGVAGAAWATIISQGVSGLLCIIYTYKKYKILRLKKEDFKVKSRVYKKTFKNWNTNGPTIFYNSYWYYDCSRSFKCFWLFSNRSIYSSIKSITNSNATSYNIWCYYGNILWTKPRSKKLHTY